MSVSVALGAKSTDRRETSERLLRFRTYMYGFVATLMLVASIGGTLERFVSLTAFTLAVSAPLVVARRDAARRIEVAVVADLVGAFVLWWSMQQAPVVGLLLVLWAVAVTAFVPSRRTGRMLMLFALVLELAKLPIAMLERAGWFPWTPGGVDIAEPLTLVVSAGGQTLIVLVAALVFRSLSFAQGDAMRRANASEAQLRAVFESPVAAIAQLSLDGVVIGVNSAMAEMLGIDVRELAGKKWFGMVGIRDRVDFARFARTAAEARKGLMRRELRLTPGQGRVVWVMMSVSYLEGDGDQPAQFIAHLQDITERITAEKALRRSEARYRTFFEQLPVAMYRTLPTGQIVDGNQALAELLGYEDPADLRGLSVLDFLVDPGIRTDLRRLLDEVGYAVGWEYELHRRDGSRIWVRDTTRVVGGLGNEHYEGTLVDVTERRRVEAELQTRARQQEAVAGLGRLALEEPDIGVAIDFCAARLTKVLEADEAYVLERSSDGTFFPAAAGDGGLGDVPEAALTLAGEAMEVTDEVAAPGYVFRPGGCAVIIPSSRHPYGAIVSLGQSDRTFSLDDVTFVQALAVMLGAAIERNRASKALEQLVQSKDEFIASVSHEVRTPLTVVAGMAEELQEGWERFSSEEVEEHVALIVDQAREMEDLVEDLLVAARADIGTMPVRMQEIHLRTEVDHVLASLAATRERGLTAPESDAKAYADPVRFRQIIRNLVTNAVRYGGNRIGIEIEVRPETVAIRVVDDGSAIPEAEQARIFEPYERAHNAEGQPGSVGLGLAVSRRLAQLMGGEVVYRYDGESIFEVVLAKAVDIVPAGVS